MSARVKKILWTGLVIYVLGAAVGLVLFHSPNLSKAYLDRYGADHERYRAIAKNEEYLRWLERPALETPTPELQEKIDFAREYEARPEFQAEHHRTEAYAWYFRVFNTLFFLVALIAPARRPLAGFLDARIASIREDFGKAEGELNAAVDAQKKAQREVEQWPQQAESIQKKTDETLAAEEAAIHEEFRNARLHLAKAMDDRKDAERLRVARMLRDELVNASLQKLEERYRQDVDGRRLEEDVDQFIKLIGQVT